MYAAFARLNYKPWYALAEFVDNSLQSALNNRDALRNVHGPDYVLMVDIEIDDEAIEIRDNAAGIAAKDYSRAFLPASPPPDTSGLSEFGLGMKAAASWFSRKWSVRTTALYEEVERTIEFDIPHIVASGTDQLEPVERHVSAEEHYTTVRLEQLSVRPKGRTLGKITDHLASIYRLFVSDGLLQIRLDGQVPSHSPPNFLRAPHHAKPTDPPVTWRKNVELDLGDGHTVRGWAGILARASVANAGFAVFRRRRLVIGSHGEGYRPETLFGKPNKFVYQRLVGELEVEGFSVSHTKDGIQWSDWEEDILAWLKRDLDREPMPLLQQATHFRARPAPEKDVIQEATRDTSTAIAQHLPPVIEEQIASAPNEDPLVPTLDDVADPDLRSETVDIQLEHARVTWRVSVEIITDASRDGWYEIADCTPDENLTKLQIRVNLAHPFLERFVSPDGDEVVSFTRLAAGLAIAEITARRVGVRNAGTIRLNLNQILRNALSGPVASGANNG